MTSITSEPVAAATQELAVRKMPLFSLTAMVVGSMIGAGIFSLPRTFGAATGPFGAIIAWVIAGGGMYMLARVFQSLAERKPDMDAGVYAYARAGFGDGNTPIAILVASVGIWAFHFTILRGVQQAAFINTIVTIAKVVPIFIFILILFFAFRLDLLGANFWGGEGMSDSANLFEQVRKTMLVTVFVFIGIEGASVYSRYAQKRSDVGSATLIGFVTVTTTMVLVTLLPFAVLPRLEIAGMRQPSMAAVLEAVVGHWGAVFISLGLLVSVLGAYLAWSLICAEVLFTAAKTKDMPSLFARENANKVPVAALWLTNIVVQLIVISTYWSRDAFSLMLNLTSSMSLIPYALVAAFAFLLARRGETYDVRPQERTRDLIIAGVAAAYTVFMVLSGGPRYLLLSAILYAPGTALYFWSRREQGQRLFTPIELTIFVVLAIGCVAGFYGLVSGQLEL